MDEAVCLPVSETQQHTHAHTPAQTDVEINNYWQYSSTDSSVETKHYILQFLLLYTTLLSYLTSCDVSASTSRTDFCSPRDVVTECSKLLYQLSHVYDNLLLSVDSGSQFAAETPLEIR